MGRVRRFTSSRRLSVPRRPSFKLILSASYSISVWGENDEMPDPLVREAAKIEIDKPENRGYSDNGIQAFKDAAAGFMECVFRVSLDPTTEINHSMGCKSALMMLPAVFINPGDVTLMTVPGYPIAGTHTKYYGGSVYDLQLREENGFLPNLEAIPADVCERAKLLVINYPNSPTGAVATRDFYREVIEFARSNQVVVVQDATHILLSYDGPPLSFLQLEGAKDVGVEIHSMSKGFSMMRLADGLCRRPSQNCPGLFGCQGQLRLWTV